MTKVRMYPIVAVLLCLFYATAFSQLSSVKGIIEGRITERTKGQPISAATVSVGDTVIATSGDDGRFRAELPPGIYDVTIRHNGFAPIIRNQIGITGGRSVYLDVSLDLTLTESVEVRSSVFSENIEQATSNVTLDREAIRQTPGTGGDPLRAINSLPSVGAASGEFADLLVRGGTSDENLVYVDRIPIEDFTYFTDRYDSGRGGRASILAPDVFNTVEFSAGGFGVRYGGKMSSVLDVSLREASRERIQGVLFADSGTAGGSLDVPLGKGSWLSSFRRSYIDLALDVAGIADQGIIGYPSTYDLTNKVVYDLTPRHKISFSVLNSFEVFQQSDEQSQNIDRRTDRFRTRRTSRRFAAGATLRSLIGSNTFSQLTVWGTGAHNDGAFYEPYTSYLRRARDLRKLRFGIKEDLSYFYNKRVELKLGGGVRADQADYHIFENLGSFSPLEEEYNSPPRDNRFILGTTTSAYTYGQATVRIGDRFSITPGLRIDRFGISGETLISPRFSARFSPSAKFAFTFASGIYRQPPDIFTVSLNSNNRNLRTQSATHVIGGFEWLIDPNFRLRVEGFRKSYSDLIIKPVVPTQYSYDNGEYFNTGHGTASGFEISLQKSMSGLFAGQASYSFLRSRRTFDADSPLVPSETERPHQLVLTGITRFFGFTFAAKYRFASGLPYTKRTAVAVFPNFPYYFVQRIASTTDVSAARLPNFMSLDIRAEKRFSFKRWSLSPYIDYFNVTNHNSIVQPNYEFYSSSAQFLSENRRLPIFGFRIEF